MADKTIIIQIKVQVDNISSKLRSTVGEFDKFAKNLTQTFGFLNTNQKKIVESVNDLSKGQKAATKTFLDFNLKARVAVAIARGIGTSMIFAGGSFRDLGVAINIAATTLSSLIPTILKVGAGLGRLVSYLGPYALLLTPIVAGLIEFTASLVVAVGQITIASVALFKIAKAGIAFNALMETTQISIATLVTQFKNLYDSEGRQIGAMTSYTDAQLKAMSAEERRVVGIQQSVAINEKLEASLADAQQAFNVLTVEAAQSPFTTAELASGFQAVVASLGQYNISTQQAAQLTVSLGRVASVAGVSASNLASQFTLFLTGTGRITSPLSRFASQVGLTKNKMLELREEFAKAKGDPEKTAAIMASLTTRLKAFDEAGRRVAQSWAGIMSNMTEAFELFSGSVTKGLFESIRNSLLQVTPVLNENKQQIIEIVDENNNVIRQKFGESAKKMASDFNNSAKKIEGEFARVKTTATGLLTEIFNYNDQGVLPANINRVADVFTDRFQPLIIIIEDLFKLIGKDIAGAITSITALVDGTGDSFEKNKAFVIEIYDYMKVIGFVIWEFVKGLGQVFGVTGEIKNTASTIETVTAVIAITLGSIRLILHAVMFVIHAISLAVKSLVLGIVAIGEGVYKVVKVIALFQAGLWNEALKEITSGFSATKVVLDSWLGTVDALINQSKGVADTFKDVGYAGVIAAKASAKRTVNTEKEIKATSALRKEYIKLAKAGKIYQDGKIRKVLEEGETITKDSKTGKLTVKDSKDKILATDVSLLDSSDIRNLKGGPLNALQRSRDEKKKNPVASTSPTDQLGGEEDKKSVAKAKELQKRIIDTLFAENKEFAEKQLEIERDKVKRQVEIVEGLLDVEKALLDDALDSNLLSYSTYFSEIAKLAEIDKNNKLAIINTETKALETQHEINARQFRQDELNALSKFEVSKRTNIDAAEYAVELAKIERKRQTETLEFDDKIREQEASRHKLNQNYVKSRIDDIKRERDLTIDFYKEVQQAQFELSSTRGGFDPDSIKSQLDSIANNSLDTFRKANAQLDVANNARSVLSGLDRAAIVDNDKLISYAQELKDLTIERVALEQQKYEISVQIEELNREELKQTRLLEALDEKRRFGVIGTLEYEKQTTQLRAEAIKSLQKRLDVLINSAAKASISKATQQEAEYTQQAYEVRAELNELYNETDTILHGINDQLRDASKEFLGEILNDVTSISDAFINLGKTIQKAFQKALIDRLFQLPSIEKIFGSEGQDSGKASGFFATLGRMIGLGQNQNRENAIQGGDIPTRIAEAVIQNQIGEKTNIDAARTTLERLSGIITEISKFFQKPIDTLTQTINGQTTITVTAATFSGVDFPTVSKPPTPTEGEDGSGSIKSLANLISRGEGGYNSFNRGRAGDSGGRTLDFSKMTLEQIQSMQNAKKLFAVGRYQIIPETLDGAIKFLKLDKNLLFNKELQDKIFQKYIIEQKQPSVKAFLEGRGSLVEAQLGLAKEFASVGVPYDVTNPKTGRKIKRGQSYWRGVGGNAASISPNETASALTALRETIIGASVSSSPTSGTDLLTTNGKTTAVNITEMSPDVTQKQAEAFKNVAQNAETVLSKGGESVKEDNILTQLSTKLDSIVLAVGEGGLGLLKTAVTSIDTKLGSGLAVELASFITQLATVLTSSVTTPIVTSINGSSLLNVTASNIEARAFGGYISGPGGPTSDKIPAWLSNGEYVIKAAAVKALGVDRLHDLNNADKELPQFGFGGFISSIFKNIGKFLTSDIAKLVLSTAIPLLAQQFLGEKAASALSLAMPFIFAGLMKPPKSEKELETSKKLFEAYRDPYKMFGQNGKIVGLPKKADGGLIKFAKGGNVFGQFAGKSKFIGGIPAAEGGFWSSPNGQAVQGGAISAALSIGMALLGRWQAKKAQKKQLEEYKKNRTKDPFGLNPETLTFYKNPIITGSRNWLAKGGPITSSMMLKGMPQFAMGGVVSNMDLEDILRNAGGGESPINLNQNINITTPDIHSFRNSKGQLERDLARVTQRGLKRRAPKY